MKKIHFAVIGCGHAGKKHINAIQRHPEAALVAVADPGIVLEMQGVRYYRSLSELLAGEPVLDVVVVATPNGLHESQALQALEKGKHVVVEKPIALSKTGAERILDKALQHSCKVFCVMQNRYAPVMSWLKEMTEQGRFGKIYLVQINCFWNRDDRYYLPDHWRGRLELDGGPLFTQFSHFLDALYWLFGDIQAVKQASFHNYAHEHSTEFEDTGVVTLELQRGGLCTVQYTTAAFDRNAESSLSILAEHGSVKVSGQYMQDIVYCIGPEDWPAPPKVSMAADNHPKVVQNVVEALRGEAPIKTNALEALKVVEIIERIYALRKI